MSDLHSILLTIGMSEVNVRYSGGSLMSVINYMAETNALAVLPFSVVFAQRKESADHRAAPSTSPSRAGASASCAAPASRAGRPRTVSPSSSRRRSRNCATSIKRHESAVVWGR